jgi:hypothetical protein
MYEENEDKCDLHLFKTPTEAHCPALEKSKLPSGDLLIQTRGDQLLIRPLSPYRYNRFPEVEEISFSNSIEEIKEVTQHQRSTTTIINDISQSYTFIQSCQKTSESPQVSSSNQSFEQLCNELKDSVMASTMDPKSFMHKPQPLFAKPEKISTIFSQSSSTKDKHSLLQPVTAFCSNCDKNVKTIVFKSDFSGNL